MIHYCTHLPDELRTMPISDDVESLQFLHCNGVIRYDIKLHGVLVTGSGQELLFKITDYAYYNTNC